MKGYAILTDSDWRSFLAPQPRIDEVNFWESGGGIAFRRLSQGYSSLI